MARNWIKSAVKRPGALRKSLHVRKGQKIPARKLQQALHSRNPKLRRRAALAKTLRKLGRRK